MAWGTLRPQIAALLDEVPSIQEVATTPKINFDGYPAAHVIPADADSVYETNVENLRVYSFTVRLFYETKNTGVAGAMDKLEEVVDAVMDKVDQEDQKGVDERIVGVGLPAGYTFLNIRAVPSRWSNFTAEQLYMVELNIRVRISRALY